MDDRLQAPGATQQDLATAMRKRRQENDDRWLAQHRALSPDDQRRELDRIRDADGTLAREWQQMLREYRRALGRRRAGRPRQRPRAAHRPAASRTGASSATSGSDPGDDDGEPEPPPAAAVNAIAAAWTASLRRRHPDYSWDARP